jgi:hypothetical protein
LRTAASALSRSSLEQPAQRTFSGIVTRIIAQSGAAGPRAA